MGGVIMKYYKVNMYTIFDDCDYSAGFAFADEMPEEEMAAAIEIEFDKYMCAFSELLGDPASYTSIAEYEKTLDYYVRNTDYDIVPITQEEFLALENKEEVKN